MVDKLASRYTISREIGIDTGHRVMTHGSKCRNFHGHRYRVQTIASAPLLIPSGEQTSMVVDFGFLKEIMMEHIDEPCDHGMILCSKDPWLDAFVKPNLIEDIQYKAERDGWVAGETYRGKIYVVPFIPTAECLAQHWFERLKEDVKDRSNGYARLESIIVHETPNCRAEYHG